MIEQVATEQLVVVLSDVEMGSGVVPLDDFPQSAWLGELVADYGRGPHAALDVHVVFAGDTFDFLKTPFEGKHPRHVTLDVAMAKVLGVAAAHSRFFAGLRRFLDSGPGARQVSFLVGNHDFELLFPEVQGALRGMIGHHDQVLFPGMRLRLGDLHVEHGQQSDTVFAVDEAHPFLEHEGERILNLPWGAVALLDVAIPMHGLLHHLDRLKPRDRVLAEVPELREVAVDRYWSYWTRDYLRGWLRGGDPIRRLSWTMFRDVVSRFGSRDLDLRLDDAYERLIREPDGPRVCVIGHLHAPGWSTYGDRKLLRTGAIRNEYMLEADGSQTLIPKVYAEIFQRGGRSVRSHLVEVEAPPPPAGYVPADPLAVRGALRALLGNADDRADAEAARARQEQNEAGDEPG